MEGQWKQYSRKVSLLLHTSAWTLPIQLLTIPWTPAMDLASCHSYWPELEDTWKIIYSRLLILWKG